MSTGALEAVAEYRRPGLSEGVTRDTEVPEDVWEGPGPGVAEHLRMDLTEAGPLRPQAVRTRLSPSTGLHGHSAGPTCLCLPQAPALKSQHPRAYHHAHGGKLDLDGWGMGLAAPHTRRPGQ